MQRPSSRNETEPVLAALAGDDCRWCDSGTLTRAEFKGDDAAVCDECATPAARVW